MSDTALSVAKACTFGIVGIGVSGFLAGILNSPPAARAKDTRAAERVRNTFLALGFGVGTTALAARHFFNSGTAEWMLTGGRWTTMLVSLGATVGTVVLTLAVPSSKPVPKLCAFAAFNSAMGLTLSPLLYVGGPVLTQAAAYTGAIAASLSVVGVTAPSREFFFMAGPLSIGLSIVSVSSFFSSLFPRAHLTHSLSLYGALAVFSGYILYDANVIITRARRQRDFDPVNECLNLYLDVLNLFVRMVAAILDGSAEKKKREHE